MAEHQAANFSSLGDASDCRLLDNGSVRYYNFEQDSIGKRSLYQQSWHCRSDDDYLRWTFNDRRCGYTVQFPVASYGAAAVFKDRSCYAVGLHICAGHDHYHIGPILAMVSGGEYIVHDRWRLHCDDSICCRLHGG